MDIQRLFASDHALYADMEAYRRSGDWTVAYDSETALWLRWNRGWLHAIAAFDLCEAKRLIAQIPVGDAIVLRGCPGLRELAEGLGFTGCNPCRQAVYEKKTPPPVRTALTIRHPDERDFSMVAESYELGTEDELREDFASPDFLGAYLDGEFIGYIGVHGEGSMGLLYVAPPYRRRGYAEALVAALLNNQLRKGRLPFAQTLADNAASLALQRKLGFTVSEDLICWVWREDKATA